MDCRRFTGRHIGENISACFTEVATEHEIMDKIGFIFTDNASNMRAAFTVNFPTECSADDIESETTDDDGIWEDLDGTDNAHVESAFDTVSHQQRLSCFAHSLQLVVSDGLKDCKCVSLAIAKAVKLTSLLHQSTVFKEKFEAAFPGRSIPVANATCWNSTYRQLQSIMSLDSKKLSEVCADDFSHVKMLSKDLAQLTEL